MAGDMLRVFIGFDENETVAFHVLAHSIMRHASVPVSVTPLILSQLPMTRMRDERQSTDFAFSRFLVPWLCDYEGSAVFMDCDMLCRTDLAELPTRGDYAVRVVKHDYMPKPGNKFLGKPQTAYAKKNWSSMMIFNNARCKALTPTLVNAASGLYLHQFQWCDEGDVGELTEDWNHLVGEFPHSPTAKLVHFTLGGPWFAAYRNCDYSKDWFAEQDRMLAYSRVGEYKHRTHA